MIRGSQWNQTRPMSTDKECTQKGRAETHNTMGKLVNFCAGADLRTHPGNPVEDLLLNTPDNGSTERRILRSRQLIEKLGARTTILDSGGYQLLQAEKKGKKIFSDPEKPFTNSKSTINLAPEHVIRAAEALNPTILIGSDFPVRRTSDPTEQTAEFQQKLSQNVQWARKISWMRKRRCPETKLFIPLQCYTLDQFDLFMSHIQGTVFDGLSMPVRNPNLHGIAQFLVRFHELGVRRVHLLGTSSFFVLAFCAYAARHLFDWLSMDSTTWRMAAQNREFLNPDNLSRVKVGKKANIRPGTKNNCSCPWCENMSFGRIRKLESSEMRLFLLRHNFLATENAMKKLYGNAFDSETLISFVERKCGDTRRIQDLRNALSCVDQIMEPSGRRQERFAVNA